MNDADRFEQLGKVLSGLMTETGVPGTAVGLLHGDQLELAGFGVTSRENPLPVTEDTLFQIGSITKTFTATAIMRLVEQGRVDLEAPIRDYLPDFRVRSEAVSAQATVRHLLTHSSGWVGDLFEDTGSNDDALQKYMELMADSEQLAPPDTVFSYNNAAFSVAGRVIERVTGQTYEAAMKELIFDPLGLAHTFFFPADVMTYRFAVGHLIMPEETTIARPWPLARSTNAAGAIATNLKDLLRYAQYHMGDGTTEDGTRLLTPDSLREMHTTHFPISDKEGSIGLAWFLRDVDGARTISHGGGTHGQITQLTVVPAERFAFALFTNGSRGGEITRKMGKWILKAYLGRAEDEPQPMEATEAQLAEVVGLYSRPFADIEVKNDNGQLMAHMTIKGGFPTREHVSPSPPPMPIAFCGDDRFIVTGGPFKDTISEIVRKADGSIGWLRSGLRIHNRVS